MEVEHLLRTRKGMEETDGFDRLPDVLILQIMNLISDAKTLLRCRSVSKRFNYIVPQTETLLLRVDRVVSTDPDTDSGSLFLSLFKSLLHLFLSPNSNVSSNPNRSKPHRAVPSQILSRFGRIRFLTVELPAGDLKFEKGASVVIKWRAEFGKSLRSCVILGFRSIVSGEAAGGEEDAEGASTAGLKARVIWTISALIAASARHYLLKEVVKGREDIERLVLIDRDGEGTVVMEHDGLLEYHRGQMEHSPGNDNHVEETNCVEDEDEDEERARTVVPSVKMRMRHLPRVRLKGGDCALGATLVVVRPYNAAAAGCCGGEDEDAELALRSFGDGVYGDAVRALLKSKCYMVEMNSF